MFGYYKFALCALNSLTMNVGTHSFFFIILLGRQGSSGSAFERAAKKRSIQREGIRSSPAQC
jgi:hypothetical protein